MKKETDTRGVGISSSRKSIYLLTTSPTSHIHRFQPLPLAQVQSMDDICGEWVECMGVVVRRYIDFLLLLIPTSLVSVFFQQHPYFLLIILNVFHSCSSTFWQLNFMYLAKIFFTQYKHTYGRLRRPMAAI